MTFTTLAGLLGGLGTLPDRHAADDRRPAPRGGPRPARHPGHVDQDAAEGPLLRLHDHCPGAVLQRGHRGHHRVRQCGTDDHGPVRGRDLRQQHRHHGNRLDRGRRGRERGGQGSGPAPHRPGRDPGPHRRKQAAQIHRRRPGGLRHLLSRHRDPAIRLSPGGKFHRLLRPVFRQFPLDFATFLAVGFILTLLMQSSSAAMALVLTAAMSGVIGLDNAAAAVIGTNIGTTTTAVFSVIGATDSAKKVAGAHNRLQPGHRDRGPVSHSRLPQGCRGDSHPDDPAHIASILAAFHTSFNLFGVILFLPFTNRLVRFLDDHIGREQSQLASPATWTTTCSRTRPWPWRPCSWSWEGSAR